MDIQSPKLGQTKHLFMFTNQLHRGQAFHETVREMTYQLENSAKHPLSFAIL